MPTLPQRLLALYDLYLRGILTDAEFTRAKAREIDRTPAATAPRPVVMVPAGPPPAPPRRPATLNPVVPGVGLALGAASIANGGLGG